MAKPRPLACAWWQRQRGAGAARPEGSAACVGLHCHLHARQDDKAKPILDRQGMANTDIQHRVPIYPGWNPDLERKVLIVIGWERLRRRCGDVVMDGIYQDGDGLG